ncbi:MAG: hypothetical protein WC382_01135 [Methanoregulaceae archaeon]|jgi:hypothetical protein
MMNRSITILLAVAVLVIALFLIPVNAANPIPPSNETAKLSVQISATSVGTLYSGSDLTYTQGNGNLADNPPLASGEGQSTAGYVEKTVATSGSTEYTKIINLDTSSQSQPQNNLETVRVIDYTNTGDGNDVGIMYSNEAVYIDACASAVEDAQSCCAWGAGAGSVLPASCITVDTGSTVYLDEGRIASDSSARVTSSDIDEGVSITYTVDVSGSGQTGNETAVGKATVYVDATIMEGSGNATNLSSVVAYDEKVTVDGLISIAMQTGYSSP